MGEIVMLQEIALEGKIYKLILNPRRAAESNFAGNHVHFTGLV